MDTITLNYGDWVSITPEGYLRINRETTYNLNYYNIKTANQTQQDIINKITGNINTSNTKTSNNNSKDLLDKELKQLDILRLLANKVKKYANLKDKLINEKDENKLVLSNRKLSNYQISINKYIQVLDNDSNFTLIKQESNRYLLTYKGKYVSATKVINEGLPENNKPQETTQKQPETQTETQTETKQDKPLTKQEKYTMDLKDIAKIVKQKLKDKYPKCVFSVTIERYSMGQSLHISLMKSNIKVIQDFDKIPDIALSYYENQRYTKQQIEDTQKSMYHQLNQYTLLEEYDNQKWCNGVFLTKEGHHLLQDAVKMTSHYNYDDSDSMVDYFDVNFYLHINIGKWNKPYELEEA